MRMRFAAAMVSILLCPATDSTTERTSSLSDLLMAPPLPLPWQDDPMT